MNEESSYAKKMGYPDKNVSWGISTPHVSIHILVYHTKSLPRLEVGKVKKFAFDNDYTCHILTLQN